MNYGESSRNDAAREALIAVQCDFAIMEIHAMAYDALVCVLGKSSAAQRRRREREKRAAQ